MFSLPLLQNVLPDNLSLLETRFVLRNMRMGSRSRSAFLVLDLLVTGGIAFVTTMLVFAVATVVLTIHLHLDHPFDLLNPDVIGGVRSDLLLTFDWDFNGFFKQSLQVWFFPTFFTSIWLWLYAGSGFLLKAARRFDIGFQWFNRGFDIEKKPLSAIGLVAGALVAVLYWGFAVGSYLMKK
jgi:hypothetical protein